MGNIQMMREFTFIPFLEPLRWRRILGQCIGSKAQVTLLAAFLSLLDEERYLLAAVTVATSVAPMKMSTTTSACLKHCGLVHYIYLSINSTVNINW